MKLAKVFTYVMPDAPAGTVYRAALTDHGDYEVTWLSDGYSDLKKAVYCADMVERLIVNAAWIVREIVVGPDLADEAPLEPADSLLSPSWPFPLMTVAPTAFSPAFVGTWSGGVNAVEPEPEFLPPDDIEPVTDYGISLLEVQQFCKDTGYTVEVDADYYAFVYDGKVEYSVPGTDVAGLASVMGALRTLTRYIDKAV